MGNQQVVPARTWTHRWTFILAAAGAAIGLGNLWKFPYMAGVNGGGAFVLAYLFFIALVGVPIMMAEVALGRHGRHSPITTMHELSRAAQVSRWWGAAGWVSGLSSILILSFYSVIAGWALYYTIGMFFGSFDHLTPDQASASFETLTLNPVRMTVWHSVFMFLTGLIVARGVHKGLESSLRVIMPCLFVLLAILLGYSIMRSGHFMEGLRFMLEFHPEDLTAQALLSAMGHAFFSLSLGMGSIMAYGVYMPKKDSIARTVAVVASLDTLIALVAGLIIFPLTFSQGMEPNQGPELMFVTLTSVFSSIPAGQFFGGLFFLLVSFAALTSSISMVEPLASWLTERFGISRVLATTGYCLLVWLMGMGTVLSFNEWSDVLFFDRTFFELIDFISANITLPLGGLLIAIFASWVMKRPHIFKELNLPTAGFNLWRALCRVVAPVAVLVIFSENLLG